MRKLSLLLLIITFLLLLTSVLAMSLSSADVFKEIHSFLGGCFITLIFVHLFFNRFALKAMLARKISKTKGSD